MIAPQTEITLYKTTIELDELNQIKWNEWADQWGYFQSLPHINLDNATYQRKDGVIRYPNDGIPFDELLRYNYVSYKNESYSNKTFFAFVKRMRYVNDGMTEIEIETDVWQTWQFDLEYHKCFVEREHVSDDTLGLHTVPENLETGEYIRQLPSTSTDTYKAWIEDDVNNPYYIIVATSDLGFDSYGRWLDHERVYNGVYSGLWYVAFPDEHEVSNYIYAMQGILSDKSEAIYSIFLAPKWMCGIGVGYTFEEETYNGVSFYCCPVNTNNAAIYLNNPGADRYITDTGKLGNNYTPKNNKCLCFPYRYITVSNNAGQTNQYRYELFPLTEYGTVTVRFGLYGTISPGCNIKLFPVDYNTKGTAPTSQDSPHFTSAYANFNEGLDGGKLPVCSWLTDSYLNWLSQNGVNLAVSAGAQTASIIAGAGMIATGAGGAVGVGLIASGIGGVANSVKQSIQAKFEPDVAHGGANSGNLNYCARRMFTPYQMSIKDEYAKIIDDYFSMFGYKVNSLKVPNIHSRRNWNYIKTIDCNVTANIQQNVPQEDLLKIRNMFNAGFTIWHNPNTFLDYSQSNNII